MGITIKKLAEIAGFSTATVSKVLNNKSNHHISVETQQKIKTLAEEYKYQPNPIAKGLRIKRTKMLAFIIPDIRNPFFPEIAKGIEDVATREGYNVIYCNTGDDESKELEYFKTLKARMVDGIIITQTLRHGTSEDIYNTQIPIVLVDRIGIDFKGIGKIFINTKKAFYESTEYLIRAGSNSIAFISAQSLSTDARLDGYKLALKDNGLVFDRDLTFLNFYDVETGFDGIKRILDTKKKVDGIVCGNDLIAFGAIKALQEKNIKVPDDVNVIGFDDIQLAKYYTPPLTTIHQPTYQYGHNAAEMLVGYIEHGIQMYNKEEKYRLVERDSVKKHIKEKNILVTQSSHTARP